MGATSRTRRGRVGTAGSPLGRTAVEAARSRACRGPAGMAGRRRRCLVLKVECRAGCRRGRRLENHHLGTEGGSRVSSAWMARRASSAGTLILACLESSVWMVTTLVRPESSVGMLNLACLESSGWMATTLVRPESSAGMSNLALQGSSAGMPNLACPGSSVWMAFLVCPADTLILACREPLACAAARRHRGALRVVARPRVDPTVPTLTTAAAAGSRTTEASRHGMKAQMKAALMAWGCCRLWAETGTTESWRPLAATGATAWWSFLAATGATAWWSSLAGTGTTESWSLAGAAAVKDRRGPTQACQTWAAPGIAPSCSRTARPQQRTAAAGAARERQGYSSTSRRPWRRGTQGAR